MARPPSGRPRAKRASRDLNISFALDLLGDDELTKDLARLEFKTQRSVVKKAFRRGMKIVLQRSQQLVPVKTAVLKNSLKIRVSSSRKGVNARVVTGTRDKLGIPADAKFYYPAVIEYGSPSRNIAPHSFMRKAMDEKRSQALTRIKQDIRHGIVRLAKR